MAGVTPFLGQQLTLDTPELDFVSAPYTRVDCAGDGSRKILSVGIFILNLITFGMSSSLDG